jgi:glutathione peroxidase-family protein
MTNWNSTLLLAGVVAACVASVQGEDKPAGPLGHKMKSITGQEVNLADYKGKVVLMVNVASECGLTGQYKNLEAIYSKHKDKGLVVLGFPCNQFGGQEPGSDQQIASFCSSNYSVTFPLFSKIEVNGAKRFAALQIPDGARHQAHGQGQDFLELRKIPDRPQRRSRRPLRAPHRAGCTGSAGRDRG